MRRILPALALALLAPGLFADEPADREALSRFQFLIGEWRCTGRSFGDASEAWQESAGWSWRIDAVGYALVGTFTDSKVFRTGVLAYRAETKDFSFSGVRPDGTEVAYAGGMKGARLILDQVVESGPASERVILHPLHDNRYLLVVEARPGGRGSYRKAIELGCTREGVPFVQVDKDKMCLVTGGMGTIGVTYQGKTYWVCCTGCRDAFDRDPGKFVQGK